ncbi:MAG: ORF6N domain-containing protein [Kiritimatiellae bacterium]|nr:ORF6N domain-containing protein [Kiritimatiellia bacterium]
MTESPARYDADDLRDRILTLRGQKVILDADLAAIYGVATKVLNQAVKRNAEKFPADFAFQLTAQEVREMWSQSVTTYEGARRLPAAAKSQRYRSPKYRPYAFTEHGAIMAATVLNSRRAVQMSVFVVRAFVRMRAALTDTRELARKLAALEREVKARLDTHDAAIVDVLSRIMNLIDPPERPEPPKKQIGFGVKEKRAPYGRDRK